MSEVQSTTLGRNWLIKTTIFLVLLLGFGLWGLTDALYYYPKRGEMDAARRLKDHLEAASKAGMLTPDQLKVTDPVRTFQELKAKEKDPTSGSFDKTRLDWLDALNRMWALKPEPRLVHDEPAAPGTPPTPAKKFYFDMREGQGYVVTAGSSEKAPVPPPALLTLLTNAMSKTNPVTPLSGFDMLTQWVFVVIGFGGGAWMLLTLVRAAAKKYRWQSETQTLTMPDGKTVTPAELKELDKRLWHKFFVVMHVKDGREYKLDLLRYQPLEDWVLAMEKTAFPEQAEEEPSETESSEAVDSAERVG